MLALWYKLVLLNALKLDYLGPHVILYGLSGGFIGKSAGFELIVVNLRLLTVKLLEICYLSVIYRCTSQTYFLWAYSFSNTSLLVLYAFKASKYWIVF